MGAALSQASTICFPPELDHPRAVLPWLSLVGLILAPICRLTSQPGHILVPCAPQPALDPSWGRWDGPAWGTLPCLFQGSPGCPQHADTQHGHTADASDEARLQQARPRTLAIHVWCTSTLPCGEKSWDTTRGLRVSHPTNNIFGVSKINHLVPQQLAFLANF